MLCGEKLQADFIRAEKMQGTTRCRWSSKYIKLLISILKHDDLGMKLNHTCDRPVDQNGVLIIIMQQIYFALDRES